MTGTTSRLALPYPTSNDPIAEGASAIQALAEALDALIGVAGLVTTDSIPAGNTWTDVATVTFPVPVPSPRVVLQNAQGYSGLDPVMLALSGVSSTGFTIRAKCASSKGGQSIHWQAMPGNLSDAVAELREEIQDARARHENNDSGDTEPEEQQP